MNTLDVLIAARAEVEKGWCKNALIDGDGNCCALGAIFRISRHGETYRVSEALGKTVGGDATNVVDFNNAPDTTKADVLAMFDRAINAEVAKVVPAADTAHTFGVAA